jgi:hypothetical protein
MRFRSAVPPHTGVGSLHLAMAPYACKGIPPIILTKRLNAFRLDPPTFRLIKQPVSVAGSAEVWVWHRSHTEHREGPMLRVK